MLLAGFEVLDFDIAFFDLGINDYRKIATAFLGYLKLLAHFGVLECVIDGKAAVLPQFLHNPHGVRTKAFLCDNDVNTD